MHHALAALAAAAVLAAPAIARANYCDSSCDIYSDCERQCFDGSSWTTCGAVGVCEEQGRPGSCGYHEDYRWTHKRELVGEYDGQCVFYYYDWVVTANCRATNGWCEDQAYFGGLEDCGPEWNEPTPSCPF